MTHFRRVCTALHCLPVMWGHVMLAFAFDKIQDAIDELPAWCYNSYKSKNWGNLMSNLPQISQAEFVVMDVVWRYAPISTNDVVDRLVKTTEWTPKTIQTMLSRLEKKGVIAHRKESRIFVYYPLIEKEAYSEAEGKNYLDRFFDGAFNQMVVSFLNKSELSADDIDELQAILDAKRKQ